MTKAKPAAHAEPATTPAAVTPEEQAARDEQARKDAAADVAARQQAQQQQLEDQVAAADKARESMPVEERAALALGPSDRAPYGAGNPAPGAAGYEPPVLNPEPGTAEFLLAHPAEITNGTITRENAG